jgi:hypothetical protein
MLGMMVPSVVPATQQVKIRGLRSKLVPWIKQGPVSKIYTIARCYCLTPVILATQKAEIRRITALSQPWQIVQETLSWKTPSQKGEGGLAQGVDPEFKLQNCKKIYIHYKKGWEYGSNGKASTWKVPGPKFKPHYHPKKSIGSVAQR